MFSIFEEQLKHEAAALDHFLHVGMDSSPEALSYFPHHEEYRVGAERYLEIIHKATQETGIPIIGSLNGVSDEGWLGYAKRIEEAGAHGLELNIYHIPTDPNLSGADVEKMYFDVFEAVKHTVKIPVAVKLSPFFSSMANVAKRFDDMGADALVMFNRFIQPDFDLDEMEVVTSLMPSAPQEIRLPLRWIAILRGQLRCSLAASRGVHTSREIVKYLLAGADVTMTTWALLQMGPEYISTLLKNLVAWMESHEYTSVAQMKGAMSQKNVANPTAFERANYIKTLSSFRSATETST
jgi:dihydroorotate dehydrogenase (fumarate)